MQNKQIENIDEKYVYFTEQFMYFKVGNKFSDYNVYKLSKFIF